MPARTGDEFLKGLLDSREVWLENERVTDVTAHPSLAGAANALAGLFDLQHQEAEVLLLADPETGEKINVSHMIPRSREDLVCRHAALERTAEYSVGLMGRTPDYMNVTYAGFAGRDDEWGAFGNEEGAAHPGRVSEGAQAQGPVAHAHDHPPHDRQEPAGHRGRRR